ncbi:hypothetical protein ACFL0D_06410 [Thermoproteota archaeon]
MDEKTNWVRFHHDPNIALYKVNGLVLSIINSTPQYSKSLFEKVSQLDYNYIFTKSVDPKSITGTVSVSGTINTLHNICFHNSVFNIWKQILTKITRETWTKVFQSSDPKENFWLLWNIFRHKRDLAIQIVKDNESIFLVDLDTSSNEYSLPYIGLLLLCEADYSLSITRLERTLIDDLNERMLDAIKKRKFSPTRVFLALIALKEVLNTKDYSDLMYLLDINKFKKSTYEFGNDSQLVETLQRIGNKIG